MARLKPVALYIHVPFCSKRCPYCAFYKLIGSPADIALFLDGIAAEMASYHGAYGKIPVRSVFLGGGTPSLLSPEEATRLWQLVHQYFDLAHLEEATMEANPESLDAARLGVFREWGGNRVSLGVQSFKKSELSVLGRDHTFGSIQQAIDAIRSSGISNFNLDLIYGLSGQSTSDLNESLDHVLAAEPTHISTYALSIEPGTVFAKTKVPTASDDDQIGFYHHIRDRLKAAGYGHYEVSAFSKPGFQSVHNLAYWRYAPYIGLGPSAASFFDGMAYKQVSSLDRYVNNPIPPVIADRVPLSSDVLYQNYMVANLRRLDGVRYTDILRDTGVDVRTTYAGPIHRFTTMGLLVDREDALQLSGTGIDVMNAILEEFV